MAEKVIVIKTDSNVQTSPVILSSVSQDSKPKKQSLKNLTPTSVEKAKEMLASGASFSDVSRELGFSRYYVRQIYDGIEVQTSGYRRVPHTRRPPITTAIPLPAEKVN